MVKVAGHPAAERQKRPKGDINARRDGEILYWGFLGLSWGHLGLILDYLGLEENIKIQIKMEKQKKHAQMCQTCRSGEL